MPGLTYQICQDNQVNDDVLNKLVAVIKEFDQNEHIGCITCDCGFMIYLHDLIR